MPRVSSRFGYQVVNATGVTGSRATARRRRGGVVGDAASRRTAFGTASATGLRSIHALREHAVASEQSSLHDQARRKSWKPPDRVPNHGVRAPIANKIHANCARVMAAERFTQSAQAGSRRARRAPIFWTTRLRAAQARVRSETNNNMGGEAGGCR